MQRLFVADLVWLFYMERMGIFQILGRILDEYAYVGGLPISNGTIQQGPRDDLTAIVLEAMVRQTEAGTSSKVRDRDSSYRRCLGWTSEAGRKLDLKTVVNEGFSTLFHKFVASALEYYRDKRLAVAIRGATVPPGGEVSTATLITIGRTLSLLKRSFANFSYGRNYANTLSGIVWAISSMALIRELRTTVGIPIGYDQPHQYIPAAYDILVLKRPVTPSEANRYDTHVQCADNARAVLLGVEALSEIADDFATANVDVLKLWVEVVEGEVEAYRTAYRSLTGVDLGAPGAPVIEQQV